MTLEEIQYFKTPQGRQLLREASELPGDDLAVITRLRKTYTPEQSRAAVHLLALRNHAKNKFSRASEMVFDREGLEQSSGETIAAHRAKRYRKFNSIADLCCGIGGDAIALAQNAHLLAVDINPNRLAITRWNAQIYNTDIHPICADASTFIPNCDAIFFDPSRRENNRRLLSLQDYHPPVNTQHLQSVTPHIGIKVAPGLPEKDIPPDCEIEFISENGVCKEAVLYFGDLRTDTSRRATLLPGNHTLIHRPTPKIPIQPPGAYIAEPDNAVIRAHLIDQIADDLNAWKLTPDVAYLSADHPLDSPFTRSYRIIDILPYNLKRLQKYLNTQHIGRLDIKKRHFPLTPETLRARLKLKGDNWAVLFLTRIQTHLTVIVCDPISPPRDQNVPHLTFI